jgi:hypothetical protein
MKWTALLLAVLPFAHFCIAANAPPTITILQPPAGASFLSATESIVVVLQDDQPVPLENAVYLLNGSRPAGGWVAIERFDDGRILRLSHAGDLRANEDYVYEMHVTDTEGATNAARIYFDTFDPNSVVIEAEDYNFDGGRFIDSPNLTPEGVPDDYAYWNKSGIPGVDFLETGPAGGLENTYRPLDAVGLERSTDFQRQRYLLAGGASADVYDYSVARFRAGEWLNYTRTFGASAYTVRLRQSLNTIPPSAALLEHVTTNANAMRVVPLGSFLYATNGGSYRTLPLTDGLGRDEVVVRPGTRGTVRLRQLTDDPSGDAIACNWLIFIPTDDPGLLGPLITEVMPLPGGTVHTTHAVIGATIADRDLAVDVGSIQLRVDAAPVPATVETTNSVVTVAFKPSNLVPGTVHTADLQFTDTLGTVQSGSWSFAVWAEGVPLLESAVQAAGPYGWEPTAMVDVESRSIRSALPPAPRFYRLRLMGGIDITPPRIESIGLEPANVIISYSL